MNRRSSKTPIFVSLRRLIGIAGQNGENLPPSDEITEILHERAVLSRRDLLKGIGGAAAFIAIGSSPLLAKKDRSAKIAIIGGGIAGLNAAYTLKKAGISAQIYEASSRTGGRIFTGKDILAPGLTTELGGEFIDSNHKDMLALVSEFGLELADRKSASEKMLISRAYFFGGRHYSESEVIEAIRPFIGKIKSDADSLPNSFDFEHPFNAASLDNTSLAEYFHRIGVSGWIKDLLEIAYITEYGLETADQSALNFITLVSADISMSFEIFGSSDEKYETKGGNSRIIQELSNRLKEQILFSYTLESIKSKGSGFTLTFNTEGSIKDIDADIVLLAIPFSILRDVDIKIELPEWKSKAIRELGYGSHTKVMVGFTKRIWREQGFIGEVFSDENFQVAWDNSQLQNGDAGGLTSFTGGKWALDAGKGTVDFQCDIMMKGIEKVFPGIKKSLNANNQRFNWTNYPFTKGSYSGYKPGQWTTIHGAESKPIGNLFFAGEHCSLEFQGFMNGGAQTGRKAAEEIIKLLD